MHAKFVTRMFMSISSPRQNNGCNGRNASNFTKGFLTPPEGVRTTGPSDRPQTAPVRVSYTTRTRTRTVYFTEHCILVSARSASHACPQVELCVALPGVEQRLP